MTQISSVITQKTEAELPGPELPSHRAKAMITQQQVRDLARHRGSILRLESPLGKQWGVGRGRSRGKRLVTAEQLEAKTLRLSQDP